MTAQYNLGLLYGNGQGVKKNLEMSYVWLDIASRSGYVYAENNKNIVAKFLSKDQIVRASELADEALEKHMIRPQSKALDSDYAQGLLAKGCIEGNLDLVKDALMNGAKINESWMGNPPLFWAVTNNKTRVTAYLIEVGVDINGQTDIAERSAIHEAALRGYFDIVQMLVENHADLNIKNKHGRTPLYYVTSPPWPLTKPENADVILKYLISHGGTM